MDALDPELEGADIDGPASGPSKSFTAMHSNFGTELRPIKAVIGRDPVQKL